MQETVNLRGRYNVICYGEDGIEKWRDVIENLVVDVGKRFALDTYLGAGTGGTCYMGLVSSTSYTAIAAGDTQASHGGWLESGSANNPTFSGTRKTCVWSAASGSSKSLSAPLTFNITSTGVCKGAFINIGGAATVADTTGTLYSCGLFSGGDKSLSSGDSLNISFTASL